LNHPGPLADNFRFHYGTQGDDGFRYAHTIGLLPCVNPISVIVGQVNTDVQIDENTTLEILVTDLTIEDPDAGDTHTLIIEDGDNYTHTGNQVTPNLDYTGPLVVNLRVHDGTDDSDVFGYALTVNPVTPVNSPPVIVGQVNTDVQIDENTTLEILVTDLTIEDPDAGDTHTLIIEDGDNYTHTCNQVTPNLDYTGPLVVNLRVNDGTVSSDLFEYALTVNPVVPVNSPPV